MVGAAIQLALSYVIVISNMDMNWDKMDTLVWVRANNYYACICLTLLILYTLFCGQVENAEVKKLKW